MEFCRKQWSIDFLQGRDRLQRFFPNFSRFFIENLYGKFEEINRSSWKVRFPAVSENTVRMSYGGWKLQFSSLQSALPPTCMHYPSTDFPPPEEATAMQRMFVVGFPRRHELHRIKRCNDAHCEFEDNRGDATTSRLSPLRRTISEWKFKRKHGRGVTSVAAPPTSATENLFHRARCYNCICSYLWTW